MSGRIGNLGFVASASASQPVSGAEPASEDASETVKATPTTTKGKGAPGIDSGFQR